MKTNEQLTALQNMAKSAGCGITVCQYQPQDKRRTVPKFFANIGSETISPVLPYCELNHFLMGYARSNGHQGDARLIAAELLTVLIRLSEKTARANGIQHSGGTIDPEDWSELYSLTNEARAAIAKATS